MKVVKRVVSLVVVTLGMCAGLMGAIAQQEVDYETDTLGNMADAMPEIESPTNLVSSELIKGRFALLQKNIPLVYHEVSHQFVEYFIYKKPEFTQRMMEQKNLYFPIYEKALARNKMPDELKYLSMIESGLNPRIISYAGAGGLWQFMRATGREFGLRQDAYIDERFDPEKSTEAACKYFRQLYSIFGDWEMALAAYNTGPGNVKRAMRRSGGTTFWTIYNALPRQTRSYVPQFVAIMYMMHYGEDHGIVPQNIEYPTVSDTLHINGFLDLATFASLSGVSMEEIQKLNPQIINTVLPDHTRNFVLKVPSQKFAIMSPNRLAILDSASEYSAPTVLLASGDNSDYNYVQKRVSHTVRSGETLTSVSRKYGVSISEIKSWNRMKSNRLLRGQRLTIVREVKVASPRPVETKIVLAKATTDVNKEEKKAATIIATTDTTDVIVAEAKDKEESIEVKPKVTKTAIAAKPMVHAVRRGETLTAISQRYGVRVSEMKELNGLSSGKILLGQKLKVSTTAKSNTEVVASQKSIPAAKPRYHTVQRGDTLWTISQRYGLTIDKIKAANKIKGNSIKAGMKLLITG
jgi:membrane-bound lytic murein transglycosylase D